MKPNTRPLGQIVPSSCSKKSTSLVASFLVLTALSVSAANFRYYRFKPTLMNDNEGEIQLSEFTFSNGGTLLNLNNRNGTGANVVNVTVSSGTQPAGDGEGPGKVVDGKPLVNGGEETKWYRNGALTDGNELVFDFTVPVTVDSYNFATGGDSDVWGRTPVSWYLHGSMDGMNWTLLDTRSNAITTVTNLTYQAGFAIPAVVPPVIESFSLRGAPNGTSAIVVNGQSVTLDWATSAADLVQLTNSGTGNTSTVAATGNSSIAPVANTTTTFTLAASKASQPTATRSTRVRTVAGGSKTYRYVRYHITKRRGGVPGMVQLSEFQFFNGASIFPLYVDQVTNPGGSNLPTADEGAMKLIDNNFDSKWLDTTNSPVVFDFGSQTAFAKYSFVTANDSDDRDPISWTLEGSNDNATWALIENVNFDYPTPLDRNRDSLPIPLPGNSLFPYIPVFGGAGSTLLAGESLTINYQTLAASTVSITASTGATIPSGLPVNGSIVVTPAATTTYTLTATSANGVSTVATFTVPVIPDPGSGGINFTNFASAAGVVLKRDAALTPTTGPLSNRLRLTPDQMSKSGAAWYAKKINATAGFEATFGMSLNKENPDGNPPADGVALVIQNDAAGRDAVSETGEAGLPANALNISFKTFGGEANSAIVQVLNGTQVLGETNVYNLPGLDLYGLPTNVFTLASEATDPAYQVRVVYVPGNLDVYIDGIAVIQNINVNLSTIGAADTNGASFFGFTARTGGFSQNNDVTNWRVRLGDFSALPPFSTVKNLYRYAQGSAVPGQVDMVWNARAGSSYRIRSSTNLATWEDVATRPGVSGQIGVRVDFPAPPVGGNGKHFFQVVEDTP